MSKSKRTWRGRYGDATEMPPSLCPSCGKLHTCAGNPRDNGVTAGPGQLGLCNWCGALNIYGADSRLRALTPEELAYIKAEEPELLRQAGEMRVRIAAERAAGMTSGPAQQRSGKA